jgi:putative flippase GtrA
LKQKIRKHKSFFGYFAAAGSGVIVQYIVGSILCIRMLGTAYETGVSIGYIASIPVGFILTKNLAFSSKKSGKTNSEILKYLVVLFFSYIITVKGAYFTLLALKAMFGEFEVTLPIIDYKFSPIGTISHFAGMGFSFIFNYFTHKFFTFSETGVRNKMKSIRKN